MPDDTPKGSVAVAHELSPADAAQLGRAEVAGFCTEGGGRTSHTAIIARAWGSLRRGRREPRPQVYSGMPLIIDGSRGEIILDPDEDALGRYRARAEIARERARHLEGDARPPAVTLDGAHIHLAANVEMLEEIPIAVDLGAVSWACSAPSSSTSSVADLPTEDEQHAARRRGPQEHAGPAHDVSHARPRRRQAAGVRAHPTAARTPPWACARSATRSTARSLPNAAARPLPRGERGAHAILFPLISGVAELRAAKQLCAEVCVDLAREGVPHDPNVPLGVMIETPSAALISDLLAAECDFLSIGTNDLIQYALAADRDDEHVGYLYHPLHPAILRALKQIVLGATGPASRWHVRRHGGRSDARLGAVGLGLRNLSMAPRQVPISSRSSARRSSSTRSACSRRPWP